MKEALAADTFLASRLKADTELRRLVGNRITSDLVDGAELPAVVFTVSSDNDVNSVEGNRIMVESTYTVKAIVRGSSYLPAVAVANRIDAVLHKAFGTTPAGDIYSCVRQGMLRYTEVSDGQQYRHLGATYRLQIQASL